MTKTDNNEQAQQEQQQQQQQETSQPPTETLPPINTQYLKKSAPSQEKEQRDK
jgi:hypothetical protein